jgi:hypothetical protein
MTDRLSLTNALADANIERAVAERIATEIFDPIHDNVATKADLQQTELRLQAGINAVRPGLALVEHRLLTRLGGLVVVVAVLIFAAIRYLPP